MDSISSAQNTTSSSASSLSFGGKALKMDDFLKIMMTQLQKQNPLEPQDSNSMLQQMAQLNTISTNESLQKSLSDLSQSLLGHQSLQASHLIGNHVHIPSQTAPLTNGADLQGGVVLPQAATNVTVVIKNQSGEIVKQLQLGNSESGLMNFKWDGTGDDGKKLPAGNYSISASGMVGTQATALETTALAKVNSVTLGDGNSGVQLNLEGFGKTDLQKILEIS